MDDFKVLFDHVTGKTPDYTKIEIEKDGIRLSVERMQTVLPVQATVAATSVQQAAVQEPVVVREAPAQGGALIKSPIVGTFYAAPSPEAPPFVKEGQTVKRGQVLCIIEAMKMMNEIESETDGVISKVLVSNGELVEYGQALFEIREG